MYVLGPLVPSWLGSFEDDVAAMLKSLPGAQPGEYRLEIAPRALLESHKLYCLLKDCGHQPSLKKE